MLSAKSSYFIFSFIYELTILRDSSESESISELKLSISQCFPAPLNPGAVRNDLLIYMLIKANMFMIEGAESTLTFSTRNQLVLLRLRFRRLYPLRS